MSTPTRVGAFVVGLAVVFVAALGVGKALGPSQTEEPAAHQMEAGEPHGDSQAGSHGDSHAGGGDAAATPAGLQVSQEGYTLALAQPRANAGRQPVSFTITGPDGHAVTAYDAQHEKLLHLIAVRRDATGFQHVHPTMAADGRWSTELDLTPGPWRIFADFKATEGAALTLGADLQVAGAYRPAAPRPDTRTASVDGFTVTLAGDLVAGGDTVLRPQVTRGGQPVELEPYLGALGHLVALRRGDLAYLHVHPEGLDFHTSVPSSGSYELFLDFQVDGVVHTASFTLSAGEAPGEAHSHDD